jgi:hypothetical protein
MFIANDARGFAAAAVNAKKNAHERSSITRADLLV